MKQLETMKMKSFTIDDEISQPLTQAIEATIEFVDGSRRWCFFMTPELCASVGDCVADTDVRVHYGCNYMVVVSRLDASIVEKVINDLNRRGELVEHTHPLT